jgi:hypothetical protein
LWTGKLYRESPQRHAAETHPQTEDYQGGGMLGAVVSIWAWIPGRWMRQ